MAALFEEKKNPQEFLRTLKTNLIPEEVYVFTPKGKVINLPPGATALDFAFKIHTEVGLHASGARVNGSPAPLKTVLKTGDIVEILTAPDKAPTRGMLAAAATAGARQELRRSLNLKSRTTSVALGRKLWEKEVRKYVLPAEFRREEDLARAAGRGPRPAGRVPGGVLPPGRARPDRRRPEAHRDRLRPGRAAPPGPARQGGGPARPRARARGSGSRTSTAR